MDVVNRANRITNPERMLLQVAAVPIAVLSLSALLIPDVFARLVGATGTGLYTYRLVGAAALGYAAALTWAALGERWVRVRLLVSSLLGFSLCGALGSMLQLLSGDTKGIVYLILVLGLVVGALTAYFLFAHRTATHPTPNISAWLAGFFVVATLVALPFAFVPLFLPVAFAQAFGLPATDLLLYRLGGAELAGYVVLGVLEVRSRNAVEIRPAAIMVLFFNIVAVLASLLAVLASKLAVLASLLALFAGERSSLPVVVTAVSGAIAAVTLFALVRRTNGSLFGDDESLASLSAR